MVGVEESWLHIHHRENRKTCVVGLGGSEIFYSLGTDFSINSSKTIVLTVILIFIPLSSLWLTTIFMAIFKKNKCVLHARKFIKTQTLMMIS
jgi:hypothetical protein